MEGKELIKNGLGNSKRGTDRALDGLTAEELAWHPRPDANSIGLILLHMARSEDSFVNSLIQGKPQLWETDKWYEKLNKSQDDAGSHYTPEQVESFVVPEITDLMAYTDAVRKQTLEFLEDLTPEKLAQKVEVERQMPFEPVVGVLLMVVVTHTAQHAGEISYLRGLKRGMDK
ncbi:DinB family protein [Chloroflexota bacterium]